jgi:zinc protease
LGRVGASHVFSAPSVGGKQNPQKSATAADFDTLDQALSVGGKSRQGAPVRRIPKIPSVTPQAGIRRGILNRLGLDAVCCFSLPRSITVLPLTMDFLTTLRRYRFFSLLFTLCLISVLLTEQIHLPTAIAATPLAIPQTVQKTVLDNGLTVLTKEVPTAPVVTVQVWYRIGSRNEAPGVNGIAHQLEHLLFKGTQSRPIQFGRLFSALGSESNAFTSYDQTAYFGTVERNKLDALLTLEADRMENAVIGEAELKSEKRVVISELQGYENSPGYRLDRAVMRAAFPNSPYGLPVGGTKADVESFTVEQVRSYYQNYYSPGNATLVIVGDFQTAPTLATVKATFGKVPARPPIAITPVPGPAPTLAPAPSASNKAPIVLNEPGSAALLSGVYPLPSVNHPDVPALHLLDLVLTQGRSSRLYQALIESGLASGFSGYPANLLAGGWYEFDATAAPGKSLDAINAVIQQTLADIRTKGVSAAELQRAKTQLRASVLLRNRDITAQATQLGDDQTTAGDYQFTDRFLQQVDRVTVTDIQRVTQTYFNPAQFTLGYFQPTKIEGNAPAATNSGQTSEKFNLGPPVDPAQVAKYLPTTNPIAPRPNEVLPQRLVLANGLRVLLLPDPSTPTVTLRGHILAGSEFDASATAGLAAMTANNLMNGTQTKDALQLATILDDRAISLGFGVNREGVDIAGNTLAEHLPTLINTLADVVQTAAFPDKELEINRQQALTGLKIQLDTPASLARRTFQQAIYPDRHPFHPFPTEASLKAIQRADVVRFYQTHYRPDSTVLTLVGDFDPVQVKGLLEQALGGWKATGTPPQVNYPPVSLPTRITRLNPALPGKAQAISLLGYSGIGRKDPRFYAATVMNQILGGDTLASRLGTEIRDRQGLTYGIYSYFQAGRNAGPFQIAMQTAPEDTQKAVTSILKLLEQLRNQGVSVSEVLAAQRSLTNLYPVQLADPDNLTDVILMNEVLGLNPLEIRQYPDQIQAVTQAQVNQAIKELLHPSQMVVVTAGPPVN